MAGGSGALLRRAARIPDLLVAASGAAAFGLLLLGLRLFARAYGGATRNVLVSITGDGVIATRRLNTPLAVEEFYTRPLVAWTYVLNVGDEEAHVARLGRRVIGVNCPVGPPRWLAWAPISSRLAKEALAILATRRFLFRRRTRVLEVMSPSALVPRALLLKRLCPVLLVTQVRGNIDLLTYAIGAYFYCRLRTRLAPLRFVAGAVHHAVAEGFFRACDQVVGYSINTLENAISNGADPTRARLNRIRIDRQILDYPLVPRAELGGFPATGRVIALWSRISPEKRVREALEAFIAVARRRDDAVLAIIGDGPQLPELKRIAMESGVGERVHFLGYRDRRYISSAARHSELAVVPYGGSSLVEAALLCLPVVAFAVEWHRELIQPGETGYLADFADARHLAAKLEEALDDPETARRYGAACRRLADAMFDPGRVGAEERRLMAQLLGADAAEAA